MRFLTWHYLQYVSNESALLISEIRATHTIIVVKNLQSMGNTSDSYKCAVVTSQKEYDIL